MPERRAQPSEDQVEGPIADSLAQPEAEPGPLHEPDPDADTAAPGGDQDIDTAGTDADDQSPTKAMGTGIAQPRSRG